jgi:N,N'-diacetyllegionaminate synthase
MKSIQIAGRWVGSGYPCFIIAEAGVNHNGDLNLAKQLIDVAADAGADAVKFQTFHADNIVTRTAEKAEYQKSTTSSDESQYDMIRKLELPDDAFRELSAYANAKGIIFLSTPFDERSVDLLDDIGVPAFKIPSGEITNFPLLKKVAEKHRPIILSTGMATLGEVEEAFQYLKENGSEDIVLLHCTTSYPAPIESVNLRAMNTLRCAFQVPVGYSDHTEGITIPIAAVAMGARVIEKHFTIDRTLPGPDHQASLEPQELQAMVISIRDVECALGNGIKIPSCIEEKNSINIRKSIVAVRSIKKGSILNADDLGIRRPGTGINPKYLYYIIGKRVNTDISQEEVLYWNQLLSN